MISAADFPHLFPWMDEFKADRERVGEAVLPNQTCKRKIQKANSENALLSDKPIKTAEKNSSAIIINYISPTIKILLVYNIHISLLISSSILINNNDNI